MDIMTSDGVRIYVLPECARCKCTGISPDAMTECPLRKFDPFGLMCKPDVCEEYTENITDENL